MERVSNGVYRSVSGYVNAFIVDGDEGVTLVDTGTPGNLGSITRALSEIGRSLSDIAAIVITHGHGDHYGSAAAAKAESGGQLFASEADAAVIRGDAKAQLPPFMGKYRFLKPLARLGPDADSVAVDRTVAGDQNIELVADMSAIQTPGHTDGHMSLLLDRAGGILFVGDAAVADRAGNIKRGLINLRTETFDNSLRKISHHDFETAYFGHSRPILHDAAGAFRRFVAAI
jgi:glyoxylase-like metal-dependent hydrolase (beta-lactamase superfamily II)